MIRPRGDLLVRAKADYNAENIVEAYMKISDEGFAKKLGISM